MIEKEIERAIKKVIALDKDTKFKTISEEEAFVDQIKHNFREGIFNFENTKRLSLNQSNKKRLVKQYDDQYSTENILCQSIKQILDRSFKIRYPNRNKITRMLFSLLPAIIQMSDFTIVKFDFKDYFNSVSSIYVFEKYLKNNISNRREIDLIRKFVYSTKYAYAGLCTSNAIAEIIAKDFDNTIRKTFNRNGLIYYERYIDDSILILNEHLEEDEIKEKLDDVITNIFHDKSFLCLKCRTAFNNEKFKYISKRKVLNSNCSIDFLGYSFFLFKEVKNKKEYIRIKYGITEAKRKKYNDRIDKLICLYTSKDSPDYNNLELLRHRIAAFTSREVYLTKYFNSNIWRVKGFISNYGELRAFLDTELIEEKTSEYLKNMVYEAFERAGIEKPYFLNWQKKLDSGYNLYKNMRRNKTILLVDHIGYDYKSLVELCKKIDISNIDSNGKRRGYGNLVRDYLIKVKVGY